MALASRGRSLFGALGALGAGLLVSSALAQGPERATLDLDARIAQAAALPRVANEARAAGIPEAQVHAALAACQRHELDAGEASPALRAVTKVAGVSAGEVELELVLEAKLAAGLRGEALVLAIEGADADTGKREKGEKGEKVRPDERGDDERGRGHDEARHEEGRGDDHRGEGHRGEAHEKRDGKHHEKRGGKHGRDDHHDDDHAPHGKPGKGHHAGTKSGHHGKGKR